MLTLLTNFILAFIFIAFMGNIITAISYPLYKKLLLKKTSLHHSNLIFYFSLLPLLLALLGSIAVNLQHNIFTPVFEHCHHNSCQAHTPQINMTNTNSQLIALFIICLALSSLLIILSRNKHLNSRLSQLNFFSLYHNKENYQIIDTPKLSAISTGLLQTKIYVSQGMIDLLNSEELDSVIFHEQAHCINKDNLKKNIIYWLSIIWPKPLKNLIRDDFILHSEYTSDYYAAQSIKKTTGNSKALSNAIKKIHQSRPSKIYQKRLHQLKHGFYKTQKLQLILFFSIFSYSLLLSLLSAYHFIAELTLN